MLGGPDCEANVVLCCLLVATSLVDGHPRHRSEVAVSTEEISLPLGDIQVRVRGNRDHFQSVGDTVRVAVRIGRPWRRIMAKMTNCATAALLVAALLAGCSSPNHGLKHTFAKGNRYTVNESKRWGNELDGVRTTLNYGFWFPPDDETALILAFLDVTNTATAARCIEYQFDYTDVDVMGTSWGEGQPHYLQPGQTITQVSGIVFNQLADGSLPYAWPKMLTVLWRAEADGTCTPL